MNASHETVSYASSSAYSTRFDSLSSQLDLTKNQTKEISKAKSDIDDQNAVLVKAQSKAQSKLDHCNGDCADEKRNLARSTEELKNYNKSTEFDSRLRTILRRSQIETYFHS